jgi:predicted TIM-barrel fold metal-dependent hydrolase
MADTSWGSRKIDVHHHYLPDFYRDIVVKSGGNPGGMPLPHFSVETVLKRLDAFDIAAAVLSIATPGVHFGDSAAAATLARRCNEYAAKFVSDHPRRLGFFGTLPMPDMDASIKEAIYVLDELKADGLCLLASIDGVFLGSPGYEPLLAELDKRSCVVFVHPHVHPTTPSIKAGAPNFLLEFVFDTSRAVMNLAVNGALRRYPNIRWILAHAGGTIPFLEYRIGWLDYRLNQVEALGKIKAAAPDGVLNDIKNLYYDTALSTAPAPLSALREFVGAEKILFGSDGTFVHDEGIRMQIEALGQERVMPRALERQVARDNALALFPRFS